MLRSVEGIVTRTIKYGETSVILDLFTAEEGLKSFIISGVRKKSGKSKSSIVQVLNLVKAETYIRDNDKLSRIKELSYSYVYASIPFDVIKSSIATFLIEICRKSVRASEDHPAMYNYIVKGLIHLDNLQSGLAHFHIHFLIGLAQHLGFQMSNNYSTANQYFNLDEGTFSSRWVNHRMSMDSELSLHLSRYLEDSNYNEAGKKERSELLFKLVDYYRYHIESFGELKSLDVLVTLFA